MPIHDSIQAITTAIADSSGLPAMGPSAHVLRDEGFKKGLGEVTVTAKVADTSRIDCLSCTIAIC